MTELEHRPATPTPAPGPTPEYLAALAATAADLDEKSRAAGTRRTYASRWRVFTTWCDQLGVSPLPATEATLIAWVAHLAQQNVSVSTLNVSLAAIRHHHQEASHAYPTGDRLSRKVDGYTRDRGRHPERQARGATPKDIERIIAAMDLTTTAAVRDRALLLLAETTGCRRSELADLRVEHVTVNEDGLDVLIPRSKTDQEGKGEHRYVAYGARRETCPVLAYQAWLSLAGISGGRVFRAVNKGGRVWGDGITDQVIARIFKDRALAAGLPGNWSGHSTRRGMATALARAGAPRDEIMKAGGWKSHAVDSYIAPVEGFRASPTRRLGF